MGYHAPSEEEYNEKRTASDFSLFPADDYILEVVQITEQPDKVDIFDKPKPGEPQRTYTGLEVRLRPISFANGDELQDENGDEPAEDRNPLFFDWLDPTRTGLKPQPSKARKFFAAAIGVELEGRIDIDGWEELLNKRVIGTVIIKPNAAGNRNNRITSYRPIRARRGRPATPASDPAATAAAKVAPAGPLPNQVDPADVFSAEDDDLPF